jgi:hypothetical protein
MDSFTAMGVTVSASLAGYDLTTAIGPFTGPGNAGFDPLCNTAGHDSCIATSLGFLRFATNEFEEGDEATFVASVTPVPEPATPGLLGSGVAALVSRSRVRTRRSEE